MFSTPVLPQCDYQANAALPVPITYGMLNEVLTSKGLRFSVASASTSRLELDDSCLYKRGMLQAVHMAACKARAHIKQSSDNRLGCIMAMAECSVMH